MAFIWCVKQKKMLLSIFFSDTNPGYHYIIMSFLQHNYDKASKQVQLYSAAAEYKLVGTAHDTNCQQINIRGHMLSTDRTSFVALIQRRADNARKFPKQRHIVHKNDP